MNGSRAKSDTRLHDRDEEGRIAFRLKTVGPLMAAAGRVRALPRDPGRDSPLQLE